MMKRLSIRNRMLTIALLPAFIVATLVTASFMINRISEIESDELRRASILAQGLAHTSEFAIASDNAALLKHVSQPVLKAPMINGVRFIDTMGSTIGQFHTDGHAPTEISQFGTILRPWVRALPLVSEITVPVIRTNLSDYEDPYFEFNQPAAEANKSALGYLTLTVDLSRSYQLQLDTLKRGLIIAILAILFTIPAAIWLANSVSQPVRTLTKTVGLLANNDYSGDTNINSGGELGVLGQGVEYLSTELQSFHKKLRRSTELATEELNDTMKQLALQNHQLEQARSDAERSSDFKTDFLANMSHEIRSPMNTIMGTMSLLNHSSMADEQRDHIKVINQSSKTLLSLIDEILDISRIESGELRLDAQETNLQQLLSEVNQTVTGLAINQGIVHLTGTTNQSFNRHIIVDPLRLKQILVNLLTNAIKFTNDGHVELKIETTARYNNCCDIEFIVVDTGIGIPQDKLKTIFSAFTQIDMSTTRKQGGSGLGLHICEEIVDLMAGTIYVKSELGSGSTFTIQMTLPFGSAIEKAKAYKEINITYIDNYAPLKSSNEALLKAAGCILSPDSDTLILDIPNSYLPSGELTNLLPKNIANFSTKIAFVSQMSSSIKIRLNALQFNGYLVRTPDIAVLHNSLIATLKGQSFDSSFHDNRNIATELPNRSHCKILAIDDQKININLLTNYFEHLNITGEYAYSATEGLAIAKKQRFELIMVDLHMPGLDGFHVAREIRYQYQINRNTPLVAVTADAYKSTREKAIENGFDELITKPITIDDVIALIREWTAPKIVIKHHDDDNKTKKTSASQTHGPLIDFEECIEAMLGNRNLALSTLDLYQKELLQFLIDYKKATTDRDTHSLYRIAHSLKGSSALCGIHPLAVASKILENHCSEKNWLAIRQTSPALRRLVQRTIKECDQLLNEHTIL